MIQIFDGWEYRYSRPPKPFDNYLRNIHNQRKEDNEYTSGLSSLSSSEAWESSIIASTVRSFECSIQ